jgi:hypothetical protein
MRFPGPLQRTLFACRSVLWLASCIVPRGQRVRWRESWTSQVWHWCLFLAESGQLNRDKKLELARFCWSAFPAAFWVRFDRDQFFQRADSVERSPATCLGGIGLFLAVVILAGGIIPALWSFLSSPLSNPERFCVIGLNGKFRRVPSETLLDLASTWKGSKLLDAVAPYSWGPGTLTASQRTVPILSARVAPEFFQVLDLHAAIGRTLRAGDEETCANCVLLSHEIWQLQLHGDPAIVGRQVTLDGSPRTVVGVLPRNFHLLSPEIAVWALLDSASPSFSNFVERIGAVARMKATATPQEVETDLADRTENAGYVLPASLLVVTSGRAEMRRYISTYLLFVLLAMTGAMLIVYVRSGGGMGRAPLSWRDRCRWWTFFAAKTGLLLLVTGLFSWRAVRWLSVYFVGSIHPMANGIALWLFLILSVAPLSWAIHDQQRRCRVCLRRLGTPIQIGATGHVLLDWAGTELMCPEGHGVLYLPDSQANWLERDRWDNLDDSWAGLFKEE